MTSQTSPAVRRERPFGMRDKIGYMFGDFGNDFMFNFSGLFLVVFETKVMGIPGTIVGGMFFIARLIDAVADVTVGVIVDKSKSTPNGKYKVMMMRFAGPAVIVSFLMFQTFTIDSPMWARIVYMYITYIIWGILYSTVNVPYGSMASVVSPEPHHRAALSTFRSTGSVLAGLIVTTVTPLVIYTSDAEGNQIIRGGDHTHIFALVSGIFSICAFICYILCYRMTTERVKLASHKETPRGERKSVGAMVKSALSSRALLGLCCSAIFMLFASSFGNSVNTFLYTDYFNSAAFLSIYSLLSSLVMLSCAPFCTALSRRLGHKFIGGFGCLFSGSVMVFLFFTHTKNAPFFITLNIICMLGMGVFKMLIWAMVTDVIDDIEVTRNLREDGTCYSVYSFSRKVGQALAGWLSGSVLSIIGYQSGATAVQSESVTNGLYMCATLLPGLMYLVAGLFITFVYPLSKKRVDHNAVVLKAARENKAVAAESEA